MASGSSRFAGTLMVAVDKTQIGSDLIVASVAREMLSITPWMAPTTRTADKMYITQIELESADTDLAPTKIAVFMASAEDASTTAASATMIYKTYDLHTPIEGGDVIQAFGTNLTDPTDDAEIGAHVLMSDIRTGMKQVFWTNPAAMNAYGTGADAYVAGATYRFNNSLRLVNCYACAGVNGTRTVTDSQGGSFKLESPDFKTKLRQEYGYQTVFENDLALGHGAAPTTLLWDVDVPTELTVAITEYLDNEVISSAAGVSWISGVGYNKTKRRE